MLCVKTGCYVYFTMDGVYGYGDLHQQQCYEDAKPTRHGCYVFRAVSFSATKPDTAVLWATAYTAAFYEIDRIKANELIVGTGDALTIIPVELVPHYAIVLGDNGYEERKLTY